jgi:hypothetical protein
MWYTILSLPLVANEIAGTPKANFQLLNGELLVYARQNFLVNTDEQVTIFLPLLE